MTIDVWMQHPTPRFLGTTCSTRCAAGPATRSPRSRRRSTSRSRRWTPPTWLRAAERVAGPGGPLISNDEVAGWVEAHPDRSRGSPPSTCARPMDAVRELRRCVSELGFKGLRVIPWLWEAPPTDRRYYPLYAACVELGVPFCTQVGHTGPLRPSETGRPIPYIDQVAIDFPELVIVCGHIGYPWTEEMVAVARKHENVYIDTSAYTARRYRRSSSPTCARGAGAARSCSGRTTR